MSVTIKPMKLKFIRNEDTWDKVITDLNDTVIFEQRGIKLFEENINKEYFDDWENQLTKIPHWNIVEVIRFI
jgi:hypothetical protein